MLAEIHPSVCLLFYSCHFQTGQFTYLIASCQQHVIIMWFSCRHCQRIDFVELTQAPEASPGLYTFYKFDSLAVATRISHNYQVQFDDGNRIII